METRAQIQTGLAIRLWTAFVLIVVYLPILCGALAGLAKGRYFVFPVKIFSGEWWGKTLDSLEIQTLVSNSLLIATIVTFVSIVFAFFGALAFARYDWKGRKLYQKVILLPVFFPQPVLGLALLLWFNALGVNPSWITAVIAHLVWIVPVVTLVIAIQVYGFDTTLEEAARDLGASRWFILREVTLPILWPGIWSGALFAFLLSWGNFPLSLYTAGVDSTVPKWLYSKMVAGYTPMVPALGTMSTLSAAALLIGGGLIGTLLRRRRMAA
ncbi:spermidine/putrescine ABC transporter permease [Agrobacterium sp. TS43]|uniref:ABC transporter permease n=1 Tax=Agrobacterium TaxID=357 RepID=UPI0004A06AEA|nr:MULTISPECIES: ABC transporter permease [Agrobacterium]KDR90334.1 spermidine/putrescine ABC transporter permease [Agrobacterium tumefaciens GW4]KVK52148.1 spermidine/putrescine ABC transporter permease [Agrobacterium sp. JL28]KVK53258.1 spermidine/putrescine ABC transporter permease [Agrobacterium sp. LY4]KVK64490.1 spermidine/putrescine ABC transporter permease [Agrobacterium sp. TS45]KVK65357.1 spermidine/putrescine ABC transporter permease [Agrobacterium sp. TS43]